MMMTEMERGMTTTARGSYLVDKRVRNQPTSYRMLLRFFGLLSNNTKGG
jgi:hypothetical protein